MFTFDLNHENAAHYAIINVSVANMRRQPVFQAEIVNQAMLGTVLPVFEQQNDFCYVENWDNYRGWINRAVLHEVNRESAREWAGAAKLLYTGNYGLVTRDRDPQSEPVSDLATCCLLAEIGTDAKFTRVQLPDGRSGYVAGDLLRTVDAHSQSVISGDAIIKTATRFLGIPYLWGGTSSKGFDCSGFVQTVFRLLNTYLPRNARQMVRLGNEIVPANDFANLQVGDLLFYGKSMERITHISIYIGDGRYIHADGAVHINSLLSDAHDFNQARLDTLLMVRRLI